MSFRVIVLFLICFSINCSVMASSSPFHPIEEKQSTGSIAEEVSNLLQHNFLLLNLTKFQRSLNENLSAKIKELKYQQNSSLLFSILFGAFIYGIFHALGPGHGKSVISSWIVGQQRHLGEVLFISIFAAVFHALSAALIVGGTYVILGKFAAVSTQKLNTDLQTAAAILLIGIGCSMIIRLIQAKLEKTKSQLEQNPTILWRKPLFVAFSIGVVPCPVTSVILIFCLSLGLIWQGILLVISFAMGMGASLVAVSLLVWSLKEKMANQKLATFQFAVTNILPIMGGVFLIFMGSIILHAL
jgi:nickel/cobalt exporter